MGVRSTGRVGLAAVAILASLAAIPAAAFATDADVYRAYEGHHNALSTAVRHYREAVDRLEERGEWNRSIARDIVRADREIDGVLDEIAAALAATTPSTDHGATAKAAGARSIALWKKANRLEIKGVKAAADGHHDRADDWFGKATATMRRMRKNARRADRAFKAAGFHPKRIGPGRGTG